MRTQQLTFSIDAATVKGTVEYPDAVAFVFNPLFVALDVPAVSGSYPIANVSLTVSESEPSYVAATEGYTAALGECRTVSIDLCKGKARVYVSRLMELFFPDPRFERSKMLIVGVFAQATKIWSGSFICIWGNVAVGDRFASYGAYRHDKEKPYWERKRIWFRNFPFMVSMFSHGTSADFIRARYDSVGYGDGIAVNAYYPLLPLYATTDDITAAAETYGWDTRNIEGQFPQERCDGEDIAGLVLLRAGGYGCFYAITHGLVLYDNWDAGTHVGASEMFVDGNGRARSDMVWTLPTGRLARFDARHCGLAELPCGRGIVTGVEKGIYEIDPAWAFPAAQRHATLRQEGDASATSPFDATFDHTFHRPGAAATITRLAIDYSTAGYYLRWIDRYGMYEYFLFAKGKRTLKNKLGSTTVEQDEPLAGMYYANHLRTAHVQGTVTCKCSAVSLDQDTYSYVATVVNSPVVDLYCGSDAYGEELWTPVNIVAASHDYTPKDVRHDLEISFTMPDINAQSL